MTKGGFQKKEEKKNREFSLTGGGVTPIPQFILKISGCHFFIHFGLSAYLDSCYEAEIVNCYKMLDKFSLKWDHFQSKWTKALSELRSSGNFADVTLICDDKVKFSAHKILLSSCSKMLRFILEENPLDKSIIFLTGMSSDDVGLVLDYIYYGEAKLHQEQLDSFLKSAKKLEIEGLWGLGDIKNEEHNSENDHDMKEVKENEIFLDNSLRIKNDKGPKKDVKQPKTESCNAPFKLKCEQCDASFSKLSNLTRHIKQIHTDQPSDRKNWMKIDVGSMTQEEIGNKIKELYKKVDGVWICLECNYENTNKGKIRRHIETHIKGLIYTCKVCHKEYGTRNSWQSHIDKVHPEGQGKKIGLAKEKLLVEVYEHYLEDKEIPEQDIENQNQPEVENKLIGGENENSTLNPLESTGNLSISTLASDSDDKIYISSMTPEEKEAQTKKMYQKIDIGWICLSCDYITTTANNSSNVRRHIVEKHFVDEPHFCDFCHQMFVQKRGLIKHIKNKHK